MSFDYRELTGALLCMDALKRFRLQNAIKGSKVFFGQPPVLDYLVEHGSCTQAELAAALGVSPASMAVSVKRMQKSGLLKKCNDENDLRRNIITITDSGRQELEKVHNEFDAIDRTTYDGFTDDELNRLKSYIERINNNLSKDLPDKKELFKFIHSDLKGKGGVD